MTRPATLVAALTAVVVACAACTSSDDPTPRSSSSPVTATPTSIAAEYESGPQTPIGYGFQVPRGAVQLGPLVRYRSDRLLAAYRPELDAALAQQEAAGQRRREQAEAEGQSPPTPTPSPTATPGDDSFDLLDEPPTPDVSVSAMRVDGSPTKVLQRVIAQANAVLPDAKLPVDDIAPYCKATEKRIQRCAVNVRGTTEDGRELQVTATIDPGDIATRTGYPSSLEKPVMVLTVAYVGDPRLGQAEKPETVDVPSDVETADTSGLIWPKMDLAAPASALKIGSWTVPAGAELLLSGQRPAFAAMELSQVEEADAAARAFATTVGKPSKDVVEDLNEVTTTYRSSNRDSQAMAVFVLAARGSFVMTFRTPRPS